MGKFLRVTKNSNRKRGAWDTEYMILEIQRAVVDEVNGRSFRENPTRKTEWKSYSHN